MTSLIVDASVALKWVVPETDSQAAEAVLASGSALSAPELVVAELANALWKRRMRDEMDAAVAELSLEKVISGFHDLAPNTALAPRAFQLACALRHPAYDCFYLALAEAREAPLVTADRKLVARLQEAGWKGEARLLGA